MFGLLLVVGAIVVFIAGWLYAVLVEGEPIVPGPPPDAADNGLSLHDLPLLLKLLAVSVPIGLTLGLITRFFFPKQSARFATYCNTTPWWHFGCFAVFFLLLALSQMTIGRWSFASFFLAFVVLELSTMVWVFFTKAKATE
jgi:hypothetical protein